MSLLKVQLNRNLRRTVLRGHPWVYKDSINIPKNISKAQLCQVLDGKNEPLAWAIYDPHSPLSLRILSLKKNPPNQNYYEELFLKALNLRKTFINLNQNTDTNCFRLFNGEGDLLPGMICDVYNEIAVLQFDGKGPREFWPKQQVADWIIKNINVKSVVEKVRRPTEEKIIQILAGEEKENIFTIKENNALFEIDIDKGQKTGFFLDQRDNRKYVQSISKGKTVLNLFSYSGGFSIYAGLGGATKVASLDVAAGAIEMANTNWKINNLNPQQHEGLCVDVFDYLNQKGEMWDYVLVDPPSMSHNEEQKERAINKYIETFTASTKRVKPGGSLFLSSCSSHISFNDFFEIINETLSNARRKGQIIRISGQGPDHPFPHISHEFRYLKFVHLVLD